ncbi:hypothetical protein BJ322DRAFT_543300 [Thelephora terrestris]|uniref:Uncharacterized protein n=1 Tax=Thelephora terrestris TaxID=56493 RepID=A0A9P6HL90_9AGAM|nr:hypothetical protein BJ322DRAFT_543300 [Thelephora terrestris]
MNFHKDRVYQPSVLSQSARSALPVSTTSKPGHPRAPTRQIHPATPRDEPFEPHDRLHLHSDHRSLMKPPLSLPYLSSSASTPSYTADIPSPVPSVRTPSTCHSSLQPPSIRPSPIQPPLASLSSEPAHSGSSKRARKHTPRSPKLPSQHSPVELPLERATKRRRVNAGRLKTVTNNRSSQPSAPSKPSPLSQPPIVSSPPLEPKPQKKKAPLHPLAVDWSRPVKLYDFDPRPPPRPLNLRGDRAPLTPYPEVPEPKRSLEDELRGPIDPEVAKEFGELLWGQQKRTQEQGGSDLDPSLFLLGPVSASDDRPSSPDQESTLIRSLPEMAMLYGPPPRNNESIHLGESLTNPNVIVVDDEEDGGFGEVLDLYRGAVQGSNLSRELEFAIGASGEWVTTGWEDVSSLQVSVKRGTPGPPSFGERQESRFLTITEYKQAVEAEKALPVPESAIPKQESPFGIEWSYSCLGYAAGRVVDLRKATMRR